MDSANTQSAYRPVLRRVGWALIAIGLLDLGLMVYCFIHQLNYSSSLNIFAVIAGIFLLRGHLGAVRYVTWFSAFLLTGLVVAAIAISPWIWPMDYWLVIFRKNPVASPAAFLLTLLVLWVLYWTYKQLRLPVVLEARAKAGKATGTPKSAFIVAGVFSIFMAVMFHMMSRSETAQHIKQLAADQYGAQYKYVISSFSGSGDHGSARLTAYRGIETKEVAVEW